MATKKRSVARKKSTRTRSTKAQMTSFRVAPDTVPFTTFRFTRQTAYWILILTFVVFLQLWIVKLQSDVAELTEALTILQQTGL
jgi:hypothetical protein